jgi:hypothetical protein
VDEVLVSAGIDERLAAADVDHLAGQPVHEVAVVRHEDERPAVVAERLQQDLLRVQVQVVRGLVEEQHVRRVQEHLREGEPVALAAREDGHALVDVVPGEQEAAQDVPDQGHHRGRAGGGHLLVHGARPLRTAAWSWAK